MNGRGFLRQVCVMIMFCLAHFLDGVARSLAAHTAGLDASIGHVVSPVARYFVDVHSAEVEPLRCIERCLQITGEDTGLQAVRRAIGQLDGLIQCIIRGNGDCGTKKFSLANLHGWSVFLSLHATWPRVAALVTLAVWIGAGFHSKQRSEEHTSELQ